MVEPVCSDATGFFVARSRKNATVAKMLPRVAFLHYIKV
jgi:hypothetical protein